MNVNERLNDERTRHLIFLRHRILQATRDYFIGHGFVEVNSPKLTTLQDDHEEHLFPVRFFDTVCFLSRTPQIYKELYVMEADLGKVFEIGPVFRAEPYTDNKHLAEFIGIDTELSKLRSVDELMALEEELISHIATSVRGSQEYKMLSQKGAAIPTRPFRRITYKEALEILSNLAEKKITGIGDKEELILSDYLRREEKTPACFIYQFPKKSFRIFYKGRDDQTTESFDFLWGWEVSSGGLREDDTELLSNFMDKAGLRAGTFEPYFEAVRRHAGEGYHGGFGIGLERLTGSLTSNFNIFDSTVFPRGYNHIDL